MQHAVAEYCADVYSLGRVLSVRTVRKGRGSHKLRLSTANGTFCVRVNRPLWSSPERAYCRLLFTRGLKGLIRCPQLLTVLRGRRSDECSAEPGASYVLWHGRHVEVYSWEPVLRTAVKYDARVITWLCHVCLACDSISAGNGAPLMSPWTETLAFAEKGASALGHGVMMQRITARMSTAQPLWKTGLVHGDMYSSNVVHLADGDLALLDFEFVHMGYRVEDIAYLAADWAGLLNGRSTRPCQMAPRAWNAFRSRYAVEPAEATSIWDVLALRHLAHYGMLSGTLHRAPEDVLAFHRSRLLTLSRCEAQLRCLWC